VLRRFWLAMIAFGLVATMAVVPTAVAQQTGTSDAELGRLGGVVVSADTGEPIEGARVFARGRSEEALTGADGRFQMQLAAQTWDVWVIHPEYSTASQSGVEVRAGEPAEVRIEMTPASVMLDAYTVTIPRIEGGTIALLEERKQGSQVADVIGAEEFSNSGASSAADALGRVTGLTVVDGKFVYVRGLGERYSSSLLDGSGLPSPEPERRVVPLDLFPTAILESVVVQKTYSADMPAEFGGGVIRMRTRSFPEEFSAGAEISLGADTLTTFQQGTTYRGGSLDWLGIDDGTRALPDRVRQAAAGSPLKRSGTFSSDGYSPAELAEIGQAMPNNYSTQPFVALPDIGLSGDIGDTFDVFDRDVGYRLALSYDRSTANERWDESFYKMGAGSLEQLNAYRFDSTTRQINLAGIFVGGVEFDEDHSLEWTSVLTRITDDNARVYEGFYDDIGDDIRVTRLQWLERQLLFEQVRGEHHFPALGDIQLDWRYAFAQARRSEPDRRDYRYDFDGRVDDWVFSTRPDGNMRTYNDLVDNSHDAGASVTVPVGLWSSLEASIKAGADFFFKDRQVSTRRFSFRADPAPPLEERSASQEELLRADNIRPDRYEIVEGSRPTDNYSATHQIVAPYLTANIPITEAVSVEAGARYEHSSQEVLTRKLFDDSELDPAQLDTGDVLPAASATWRFADQMQLRAGLARTVNRPDFREMSPACFDDVVGGRQICGNTALERAQISHFDTRWEWFPSRQEVVSAGVFYKHFDAPIEVVVVPGATPQLTYQNAQGANNWGVEFDGRKSLSFLGAPMRDFFVAGNVALIFSEITIDTGADEVVMTNTSRPLQGQSPFVLNVQFGYEDSDRGTSATMLYNVFGERIAGVGIYGQPDLYDRPHHVVDFVFSQRLGESFKLGLKAQNLLDPGVGSRIGEEFSRRQRHGRSLSAKLSWEY
jgi:hypothetical protein